MATPLPTAIFWLSAALLVTAILAGGSSQFGMVSTVVVELASLPLLGLAGWNAARRGFAGMGWPLAILAAGVAIAAAQLIPLPIDLWRALPGRADAMTAIAATGGHLAWRAASLAPAATVRSLLSLLPGIALFLAVGAMDGSARRKLAWLLLGLAGISAIVGMAQATGRVPSAYTVTNPSMAVGFFANRNHLASLLCLCLPFVAALARPADRHAPEHARSSGIAAAATGALLLLGVATTGSRAGLMLAVLGLLGAAAIVWRGRTHKGEGGKPWILVVLAIGAVLVLASLQFTRISAFGRVGVLDEGRASVTAATLAAAGKYVPIGAGLGAFVPAYEAAEPLSTLTSEYFNHAHDDWAELWLEGGAFLAVVAAAFVAWCAVAAHAAWRSSADVDYSGAPAFARAASIAIGLALIHSAADYPLRTTAMMTAFAFAGALLTPAPKIQASVRRSARPPGRRHQ